MLWQMTIQTFKIRTEKRRMVEGITPPDVPQDTLDLMKRSCPGARWAAYRNMAFDRPDLDIYSSWP